MIAFRYRLHFARFGIDALDIDAPFFCRLHEYLAAIRTPKWFGLSATSRRRLIATHAFRDIEIVIGRQIFWRRSGLHRGYEKIGLAIGPLNEAASSIDVADKRQT